MTMKDWSDEDTEVQINKAISGHNSFLVNSP